MNNVTDKTSSPVRLFAGFRTYAKRFAVGGAVVGVTTYLATGFSRATPLALLYLGWVLVHAILWAAIFTAGQNWTNKQRNGAISVAVFVASGFVLYVVKSFLMSL